MKILLVQDHLRSGGTERQTLLLARGFAFAGHAVTLLTFRPGGQLASTLAGAGIEHKVLQSSDLGLDWFAPGLTRTAAAIDPNIILCMGRMANSYAGRLQSHCPRAVVIGTLRTGKPLPWLFRRSLSRVRHLIANSRAAGSLLTGRYGVPADKITVIHNSLVFTPDAAAAAPRAATPLTLLNVAMFRPEKNQRGLIELCRQLPAGLDWRLILAGNGPTLASCRDFAARSGVGDRVDFRGFTPNPAALYREADVAVLTSQSESLPNFLCEAQAHGLPVVAYDVGGVGECFVPGSSGFLIPNGDQAAFLARLTELLQDAGLRARFSTAARGHALENFDPTRQIRRYLDLFARVVSA